MIHLKTLEKRWVLRIFNHIYNRLYGCLPGRLFVILFRSIVGQGYRLVHRFRNLVALNIKPKLLHDDSRAKATSPLNRVKDTNMANPDIEETQAHEKLLSQAAEPITTPLDDTDVKVEAEAPMNAAATDETPTDEPPTDETPTDETDGTGLDEASSVSSAAMSSATEPSGVAASKTATASNVQSEMPFALVQGEPLTTIPHDLYIPPDALEVILEAFEGPLDLLLYLIKKKNIDILEIPLEETTRQYMHYIDLMQNLKIELASEYLLMAAMLAEIKSRMLLPRPAESEDEDDPRAELIRRLQEYERFKTAAQDIDSLPRVDREIHLTDIEPPEMHQEKPVPEVDLRDILFAFKDAMSRAEMYSHHHIQREALSVRERMSRVLAAISADGFTDYTSLFSIEEGRRGVVVTLLAILELVKEQLIDLVQSEAFAPIHLKAVSAENVLSNE